MSWLEQLVQTYEESEEIVGKFGLDGMKSVLPPVGHILGDAQIEIVLNGEGELISVEVLPKEKQQTLLPCTLDSASRTSTTAPPHPLHDKLFYIARDCGNFVPRKEKKAKKGKKGEEKASPHERYVALLAAWEQSPYADPKIHAVYRYVTEHDVIGELIAKGILYKDAQGRMMEKWAGKQKEKPPIFKAGSKSPLESVVRFRVELDGDPCPELWKDARLQKKYQQFFQQCFSHMKEGLCYATGKQLLVTDKHGRGIRTPGDTTKLISSNDGDGFTFRGRFAEAGECISLGYETSQKALNTLGWLMREQGYSVGSRAFLAWGRVALPSVFDSTEQFVRRRRQKGSSLPLTMRAWAESFAKALKGYRFAFQRAEKSQVNVMVLDAATKGRLAICYYDEMAGEDFLERIEKWHTVGRWWQRDCDETAKKDKSWYPAYYGIPDPKKLIAACRGEKISDKQLDMEMHRIFFSIVQGVPLPIDMERMAFQRVIKRAACDPLPEWEHLLLEPACSIVCKRLNQRREEYTVALDKEKTERAYLFGRLLAAADQMERATFKPEERGSRTTNAMRYMNRFASRPASTWMEVQMKLLPYQEKREKYGGKEKHLIDEILHTFAAEDFRSDAPLGVEFLLGLSCQRYVLVKEMDETEKAEEGKS